MATIAELIQQQTERRAEYERKQEEQARKWAAENLARDRKRISEALASCGVTEFTFADDTATAIIEGRYFVKYGHQDWLVRAGKSIEVCGPHLLDEIVEADKLDRLNNRPYVERMLAQIRRGEWDDNYAESEAKLAPFKDELTAAWEAWHAEQQRKWAETNAPQPTIDDLTAQNATLSAAVDALSKRVAALEAQTSAPAPAPVTEVSSVEAPPSDVRKISLPREPLDDWYVRFAAASITGQMTVDKRQELNGLLVEIAALIEEHGS